MLKKVVMIKIKIQLSPEQCITGIEFIYVLLRSVVLIQFAWCLTDWGRVTHICVSKITIIVSDNGLSPERRQAII